MTLPFFIIRRFFPVFTAFLILVFSLLCVFIFNDSLTQFFFSLIFLIFIFFLFSFLILGKEGKNLWLLIINFALLIAANVFFIVFIRNQFFKIFFIIFLSFLVWLFLEIIFRFLYEPRRYPIYALENISFLTSFLAIFFLFSDFFALQSFFNFSMIYHLFFIFLFTALITYFIFRVIKLPIEKKYLLVISLIITEIFYSFTFLPTSFYINGLLLTVLFYLMINLTRKDKESLLTFKIIKKYIFLGLAALILIIIMAKWR